MYIKNAPAYSGIRKRRYSVKHPKIEKMDVELRTLDEIIQGNIRINFIKIDVEGGEFDALKGAKQILVKYKPKVIFEFGLGASEFYGTTPLELYNYITDPQILCVWGIETVFLSAESKERTELRK